MLVYQIRIACLCSTGKKMLISQPAVALSTAGPAGDVVEPMDIADGKASQSTLSSGSKKGAANIAPLGSDLKRQPLQPGVVMTETSRFDQVFSFP